MTDFTKLCTPAMIYFVFGMITLVLAIFNNLQVITILISAFFIFAWTWFLHFLCSKGYTTVSWILVLLPFISMLLIFLMMLTTAVIVGGNIDLGGNGNVYTGGNVANYNCRGWACGF